MMSNENPTFNRFPFLQWLGVAGVGAMLTLALMMGRYAQQVDEIAEDVEAIRVETIAMGDTLDELAKDQAVQGETNKSFEARLSKLETAKHAAN